MRVARTCLAIALVAASAACSGDDATSSPTSTAPTVVTASTVVTTSTTPVTTTTDPTTTTTSTADTSSTQPTTATTTTTTPPTTTTSEPAPSTTVAAEVDVKVYFLRDEQLVIAHREVTGPAVLRGALTELLTAPTADEVADGLHSEIPAGTELLGVDLVDGLATVDLSSSVEGGGGSLSMTARIAQIVFTATQFPNVDEVLFWLDGEPVTFFGGEGIVLDEPVSRNGIQRTFTGGLLFDTPAYGSTVRSPFVVTGEGDVFEGQFAIEVWADGVQIDTVAPVTAGAWGNWADFTTTVRLDDVSGPIQLIVRDGGGCGTDPECPPAVDTVLPLTLAP
ncbi:MAG: GerMN domain-containing protein [Ilumatobacteraceae bacterium]|nr:GerMN domain-containing protein [Ilumatobacteraceae bacterium]